MTTTELLRVAHHESGHTVAALLAGVEGVRCQLDPPEHPTLAGATWFNPHGNYAIPEVAGFVHWAGAYAESRFMRTSLAATIASPSCSLDLPHFEMIRRVHPSIDRDWADLIAPHWQVIERTAVALATQKTPLLSSDHLPTAEHAEQILAGFR